MSEMEIGYYGEDGMFYSAYDGEQTDEAIRRALPGGDIDQIIGGMTVSFSIKRESGEEVTETLVPFQSLIGTMPLKVLNLTLDLSKVTNRYLVEYHTIFTATAELKAYFNTSLNTEYCIRFNKMPTWREGAVYEISFLYLYGQTVQDKSDVDYGKKIVAAIIKEW